MLVLNIGLATFVVVKKVNKYSYILELGELSQLFINYYCCMITLNVKEELKMK
jgi:hypothetical protein